MSFNAHVHPAPGARDDSTYARCVDTWYEGQGDPPTEAEYEAGHAAGAAIVASAMLRNERNRRLLACDWTQLPDVPEAIRDAWLDYRQALRDLPDQVADPANPDWPPRPA